MIIQETIEDWTTLIKTYSDQGVMIRKVGTEELYEEAIDPASCNRQYEETDIPIQHEDMPPQDGMDGE